MRIHAIVFTSLLGAAAGAFAQDFSRHPAVFASCQPASIDASTIVVGHPASPRWKIVHANRDHPAIVVHRGWAERKVDPNTFLVQPPAHVVWTVVPDSPPALAHAASIGTERSQ